MNFSKLLPYLAYSLLIAPLCGCTFGGNEVLSSRDVQRILELRKGSVDTLKFWSMKELGNKAILVGVYQQPESAHILVLQGSKDRKAWTPSSADTLEGARSLNETEWTNINSQPYLYLEYQVARDKAYANSHKKAAAGLYSTLFFTLFDPFLAKTLSLHYSLCNTTGKNEPDAVHAIGKFDKKELDSLKKYPAMLAFLQRKVSVSTLIPEEIRGGGLPSADLVLKRWAMLNGGIYDALSNADTKSLNLNIEEYNVDILPALSDYENDKEAFKSDIISAENGIYRVESKVKGPVYVLNKNTKKSFLVWAPENDMLYASKLKLRSGSILSLWPDTTLSASKANTLIEIDLSQKTIRKIKDKK